jgi:hypothetical protein
VKSGEDAGPEEALEGIATIQRNWYCAAGDARGVRDGLVSLWGGPNPCRDRSVGRQSGEGNAAAVRTTVCALGWQAHLKSTREGAALGPPNEVQAVTRRLVALYGAAAAAAALLGAWLPTVVDSPPPSSVAADTDRVEGHTTGLEALQIPGAPLSRTAPSAAISRRCHLAVAQLGRTRARSIRRPQTRSTSVRALPPLATRATAFLGANSIGVAGCRIGG